MSPNKQSPNKPRYARDEIVKIVSDFYTFLTRLHIPTSALKHPPPEGWPNINPETTKSFNKSPLVIDLIKHLPYIADTNSGEMITNIHYKCDVVDWSVMTAADFAAEGTAKHFCRTGEMGLLCWIDELESSRKSHLERKEESGDNGGSEGESSDEECDDDDEGWDRFNCGDDPENSDVPNLIGIAQGYESGGRDFALDVFKGVVYEDVIRCNQMGGVDIAEFFQNMREQYETLNFVPIQGEFFEDGCGDSEAPDVDEYREIYFSHGWPGDGFRKEEALAAVEKARQRRESEEFGSSD
ncbi:hypothetical protein EKO04_004553 [Ascochyta lentis]|uniref:Uncharacterized protein n=1 Tax=Ascochyta lentis TaxID=205686 RepID=A0A8H7J3T3_9PLEO|nr:hypothetical protein EKO04_004553 [Ascochyta lentis]